MIAMFGSAGIASSSCENASNPPADAPMPTMVRTWPGPEQARDATGERNFVPFVDLRVLRVLGVSAGGLGILFPAYPARGGRRMEDRENGGWSPAVSPFTTVRTGKLLGRRL